MISDYQSRYRQTFNPYQKTKVWVYPSPSFKEDFRIRLDSTDFTRLNNLLINLRFTRRVNSTSYDGMFNMRSFDKLLKRAEERKVYELHVHPMLQNRFDTWDKQRQENLSIKQMEDYPLGDDYFRASDLRNYQRVGGRFAYIAKKVLILDEPGTGKTIEAATAIQQAWDFANVRKILIICPAAVRTNWKAELLRWTQIPKENIFVADSNLANDRLLYIMAATYSSFEGVIIINWETVRLQMIKDYLRASNYDMIVADEIHRARNIKSKQSKVFIDLKAPRQIGLTGTPVVNKAEDLFPLVNWLYPDQYDDPINFQEDFVEDPRTKVRKARANDPMGETMKLELDYFTIRREKKDILKDLPEKSYNDVAVELFPKQRKLYNKMRDELIMKLENGDIVEATIALTKIMRLKQIAISPACIPAVQESTLSETTLAMDTSAKLDWVINFLEETDDKKIVVFSQYDAVIRLLEHRILKEKFWKYNQFKYAFACSRKHLNGTTVKDIKTLEEAFWNDPKLKCWIGTIKTGGEGINLHCSDTVVIIDQWWNAAMMQQAEDRVHRYGQKNPVTIYNLYAQNTIEQYIQELIRSKQDVSDMMIRTDKLLEMLRKDQRENK